MMIPKVFASSGFRGCRKRAAFANTVLKNGSKCSLTPCKLRFFAILSLTLPALAAFCDTLFSVRLLRVVTLGLPFMCGTVDAHELNTGQLAFYRSEGYLVLPALFHGTDSVQLERQVQQAIDEGWRHSPGDGGYRKVDADGAVYVFGSGFMPGRDTQPLHRIVWAGGRYPELLALGRRSYLTVPVAQLLGCPRASHLINQIHPKLPGDGVRYAIHRDIDNRRSYDPHWQDVQGNGSFVQTLVAIDAMGHKNGGLFVFPRSHHSDAPVKGNPERDVSFHWKAYGEPLMLELQPGDTVFFHPYLVHYSDENRSGQARRAFINGFACPGANHGQYPGSGSGEEILLWP